MITNPGICGQEIGDTLRESFLTEHLCKTYQRHLEHDGISVTVEILAFEVNIG